MAGKSGGKSGGGGAVKSVRIGRLIIEFAAETGDIDQKAEQTKTKVQKLMEHLKNNIGKYALAGGAAFLAFKGVSAAVDGVVSAAKGFKNMATDVYENTKAQQRFADRMGMSVQAVQAFDAIGQKFGLTADDMNQSLSDMSERIGDAALTQGGGGFEALNALGLDIDKIRQLNPEEQFLTIAEAISKVDNVADQLHIADSMFGGKGQDMLPLLRQGRAGLEEFRAALEANGTVMSGPQAENVNKVNQAFDRLGQAFEAIKNQLAANFAEELLPFLNTVIQLAGWVIGLVKALWEWIKVLSPLAWLIKGFNAIPDMLKQFGIEIPKIENPFENIKIGAEKAVAGVSALKEKLTDMSKSLDDMLKANREEMLGWKIGPELAKLQMMKEEMQKLNRSITPKEKEKLEYLKKNYPDDPLILALERREKGTLSEADQKKFDQLEKFAKFKRMRDLASDVQFAGAAVQGSAEAITSINQNRFTMRDDLLNVNQSQLAEARTHTQLLKSVSESLQYMNQPVFK